MYLNLQSWNVSMAHWAQKHVNGTLQMNGNVYLMKIFSFDSLLMKFKSWRFEISVLINLWQAVSDWFLFIPITCEYCSLTWPFRIKIFYNKFEFFITCVIVHAFISVIYFLEVYIVVLWVKICWLIAWKWLNFICFAFLLPYSIEVVLAVILLMICC